MVDRPTDQTKVMPWIIGGTALTGLAGLGALAYMARGKPVSLLREAGHSATTMQTVDDILARAREHLKGLQPLELNLGAAEKDLAEHARFLKGLPGGGQTSPRVSGHLSLIKEAWAAHARLLW